jgi:plastocyanin
MPVLLVGCGGGKSGATACTVSTATASTRAFVDAKGFTPTCAKAKRGVRFAFGNLDEAAHTVSSSKDSPQPFSADMPKKNSLFSVKLTKPGTYHVTASGGAKLTLFVT